VGIRKVHIKKKALEVLSVKDVIKDLLMASTFMSLTD